MQRINWVVVVLAFVTLSAGCDADEEELAVEEFTTGELAEELEPEMEELAAEEPAFDELVMEEARLVLESDNMAGDAVTLGDDAQSDCIIPRGDVVDYAHIGEGHWGGWAACYSYCPPGAYVYSVRLKSMVYKGGGKDDQAMTGIELGCRNRSTGVHQSYITSSVSPYGEWLARSYPSPNYLSNPFVGGRMKIVAPLGKSGDDTAANAVQMKSKSGVHVEPQYLMYSGSWTPTATCSAGSAVCGLKTRVDSDSGQLVDDTALNGIRLACCAF